MSHATLIKRLDDVIAKWRDRKETERIDDELHRDSAHLLAGVFLDAPLDVLDASLDRGLALAECVRIGCDENDQDVARARRVLRRIDNDPNLAVDPGKRIEALKNQAIEFLVHGLIEEFVICMHKIGNAEHQLERWREAACTYQVVLRICEALQLARHIPRLLLNTAQALRGHESWETVRSHFDKCEASLGQARLDQIERNEIRTACLIDGAPCYVEMARKAGPAAKVCEGIARARRDTKKGIALARESGLSQFVEQGEVNLLQLDELADEYNCK